MEHDHSGNAVTPSAGSAQEPMDGRPLVPDHELVRSIGRGSYGEVWLARSVLGMLRAVKIVYRSRFRDARPYEREFSGILRVEPLSRAHEGLVDILHVGRREPEGYFYYVMELADDSEDGAATESDLSAQIAHYQPRTLSRELKQRGRLTFEECVQLGLTLSSALSHIHQSGLIHRDVKPSNILYIVGVPKLGDIGLVGEAGESLSYVGTEGYIPPEGPGTPQADVFSLGKVLYEASTGLDRLDFPVLPTLLGDGPAQAQLSELNEVVLKACAPDPRKRYETAQELHADLALLHRGQSVRQQRKVQRYWRRASVAGYFGAAAAGLAAGILWSPLQRTPGNAPSSPRSATSQAKQTAVDLSKFYNFALTNNWLRDFEGNDLSALPAGWNRFGEAYFNAAGVLQLAGGYLNSRVRDLPDAVKGIPLDRKCRRLHFLHGTVWPIAKGKLVGSYVIHYTDGRREEILLSYGNEFENWWWDRKHPLDASQATLAWVGTNAATGSESRLRLYSITWNNPYPDAPLARLDFHSARSSSCPFLIAVTAE